MIDQIPMPTALDRSTTVFEGIRLGARPTIRPRIQSVPASVTSCARFFGPMTVPVHAIPIRQRTINVVGSDQGQCVGVQRPFSEGHRLQIAILWSPCGQIHQDKSHVTGWSFKVHESTTMIYDKNTQSSQNCAIRKVRVW